MAERTFDIGCTPKFSIRADVNALSRDGVFGLPSGQRTLSQLPGDEFPRPPLLGLYDPKRASRKTFDVDIFLEVARNASKNCENDLAMTLQDFNLRSGNYGGRYAYSVSAAVINRRCLRRNWPGHWRLFAWRMSGFDRAGIYWRAARHVVGRKARAAGVVGLAGRRHEVSDYLVDYRRGAVCRFDQLGHATVVVMTLSN